MLDCIWINAYLCLFILFVYVYLNAVCVELCLLHFLYLFLCLHVCLFVFICFFVVVFCLLACLFICLFVYLSACILSVKFFIGLFICLSVCLFVQFVCLSSLSVCPSVCWTNTHLNIFQEYQNKSLTSKPGKHSRHSNGLELPGDILLLPLNGKTKIL